MDDNRIFLQIQEKIMTKPATTDCPVCGQFLHQKAVTVPFTEISGDKATNCLHIQFERPTSSMAPYSYFVFGADNGRRFGFALTRQGAHMLAEEYLKHD